MASKAAERPAVRLTGAAVRPDAASRAFESIEQHIKNNNKLLRSELRHLPQYKRFSKVEKVNVMFKNLNADELENAMAYCKRAKGSKRSKQQSEDCQDTQPKAAAS